MSWNPFSRQGPSAGPMTGRPEQRLLLGWDDGIPQIPTSIAPGMVAPGSGARAVTYDGDAPLLTCASTGAGKGRGTLIPTLLNYTGPVIVTDIKGELYEVTHRFRQAMGQKIVVLDFFRLMTNRSDCFNFLDLMTLPRSDVDSDAEMIASLLGDGHQFSNDPYWGTMANGLIAGLIAHIASFPDDARHLGTLRGCLFFKDLDITLATLLETNGVGNRMVRDQFAAYLTAPADKTRPCIRSMAGSYLSALGSSQVLECIRTSSFKLQDVYDGKPLTIYIIFPPGYLMNPLEYAMGLKNISAGAAEARARRLNQAAAGRPLTHDEKVGLAGLIGFFVIIGILIWRRKQSPVC